MIRLIATVDERGLLEPGLGAWQLPGQAEAWVGQVQDADLCVEPAVLAQLPAVLQARGGWVYGDDPGVPGWVVLDHENLLDRYVWPQVPQRPMLAVLGGFALFHRLAHLADELRLARLRQAGAGATEAFPWADLFQIGPWFDQEHPRSGPLPGAESQVWVDSYTRHEAHRRRD